MVENPTLSRKMDVRLRSLREHVQALPWYVERFGTVTDPTYETEWLALEAEWRDTLDRFEWPHERFLAGDLSPEQAERHQRNLELLAASVPLIRRLGLKMPGSSL